MPGKNDNYNGHISPNNYGSSSYESEGTADVEPYDEINLKQLLFSMGRRKWLILSTVILFGLIGALIAFMSTPTYQSSGSILIYKPQSKLSGLNMEGTLGEMVSNNYGIGLGTTLDNELQVLRSRRLAINIADSLLNKRLMPNGRQFPVIFRNYPDDSTLASPDTVVLRLAERLVFKKVETGADVINVVYKSPSAIASGRVVNIALSQFNKLSKNENRSSVNSTASFLRKEKSNIEDSLAAAEEHLRVFMNNHKLVEVDTQTKELIQQMADLEGRRQEARAKLVAARSGIDKYQSELNSIKPGLAEQYSEAVGPDISRLQYAKSELELQKQQLLTLNPRLDENSPQVKKLNRQIASYKNRIKTLTQKVVDQSDQYLTFLNGAGVTEEVSEINQKLIELQVQQNQYQSEVAITSSQLKQQQNFFDQLPDNMVKLAKLKRDVKINETLFEMVSRQYAETSIQERSQFGLGRIIDDGYTPQEPVSPNKPLYILLGMILGGVISVGYVFVDVAFLTVIKGTARMEKMPVPLLGVLPSVRAYAADYYNGNQSTKIEGERVSTELVTFLAPDSAIAEPFRDLENNLFHANESAKLRTIAVTSFTEGEGKSTTVANLGATLTEAGHQVLCVDTDFRRPKLHRIFGLTLTPGITEVLSGNSRAEDAMQPTCVPGLSLLSTGRCPDNIASTMKSKSFLGLLKDLETPFDFILIDTAPFGEFADSALMLKQTDGVAVTAKFGKTSDVILKKTLKKLRRLNVNIRGTILTGYNYDKSNDIYPASNYYQKQQGYSAYEKKG